LSSQSGKSESPFTIPHRDLQDVLKDQHLAVLGDAYVNFVYSLALSKKVDKPVGKKVQSWILAKALRKAGLRELLPSRVDRHRQADAAEALMIFAWVRGFVTIEECVSILEKEEAPDEGFAILLRTILKRIRF